MAKLTIKQKKFADEYIISDEMETLSRYMDRLSKSRTPEQMHRNSVDLKMYAIQRLAKRYSNWEEYIPDELAVEAVNIMCDANSSYAQRSACRIILELKYGKEKANRLLDANAVVDKRSDALVRKWTKLVVQRDGCCVNCGSHRNLEAHHISHWSSDPLNRINVDNGMTLCKECHSNEHPELARLIKSRGGALDE